MNIILLIIFIFGLTVSIQRLKSHNQVGVLSLMAFAFFIVSLIIDNLSVGGVLYILNSIVKIMAWACLIYSNLFLDRMPAIKPNSTCNPNTLAISPTETRSFHTNTKPTDIPSPKKPLVNILSLQIFVEPTADCKIPFSGNIALFVPDGLLQRASDEMNLGRHLEYYATEHPPKCTLINAFDSDSQRAEFFKMNSPVETWYTYFEHGGLGYRYNVVVALDAVTYRAAEATRAQGVSIEFALIDPDELRKGLKR